MRKNCYYINTCTYIYVHATEMHIYTNQIPVSAESRNMHLSSLDLF